MIANSSQLKRGMHVSVLRAFIRLENIGDTIRKEMVAFRNTAGLFFKSSCLLLQALEDAL